MKRTMCRFAGRHSRPSHRRRGFTVPEMLAVVAVIVIVISILLPSLGQGREIARETVCQSNMHQIALASRGYTTDTRFLPNGYNADYIVWIPEIFGYSSRDPKMYYCPSAPSAAVWPGILRGSSLPAAYGYREGDFRISIYANFSYGHNNGGSADGSNLGVGDHVSHGWIPVSKVVAPSNFIMYGDSTVDGLWDHFIDEDYEDGTGRTEYPADRHRGGAFLAFGDGHVEHQLQKYVYHLGPVGTALPEQRRRWNNDNQPH